MIALAPWLGGILAASLLLPQESDPRSSPEPSPVASLGDDSRAIDATIRNAVARVIGQGVILFNEQRDPAGCYRLYQGALLSLEPLLAHHPELQGSITSGMARAAELASTDMSRAAFELRGLLDRTFEETKTSVSPSQPLWERLGGEEAVRAVVHDFVALAAGDEEVDFFREGRYALDTDGIARLEQLIVEFVSSATGGPLEYTGRPMAPSHAGMGITEAEFNALAADLVAVLRKYEVPQDEIDELIGIIATTRDQIVEE